MRFTSTLSIAAVIALASAGSAMAAGFGTLEGVQAKPLSTTELASVRGEAITMYFPTGATSDPTPFPIDADGVTLDVPVIGGVGVENTPPIQ